MAHAAVQVIFTINLKIPFQYRNTFVWDFFSENSHHKCIFLLSAVLAEMNPIHVESSKE